LSKNIGYYEEPKVRNENSLFMNSSVAFGSRDLDDFLLQSGDISVMSDLFHNQRKKNNGVNKGSGRKEEGKDEKDMVRGNEVEETKDIGYSDAVEEVRDREISADCRRVRDSDMLANTVESSPSIDCQNCIETQVQGPESSYVGKVDEVDLDLLAKEVPRNMGLDVNDGGCMEKGNANSEEAIGTGDAHGVKLELDTSKFEFDHIGDSQFDKSYSNPSNHIGNVNTKSVESLEQIEPVLDNGMRKTLEKSFTSTNLLETSPVASKVSSASHCLSRYHFQFNHLQLIFATSNL